MVDKSDDEIHLEAAFAATSRNSQHTRTAQCPEEPVYWDFLDDETLVSPLIQDHFAHCGFCLAQLAQVSALMGEEAPGSTTESLATEKILEEKLRSGPLVHIRMEGQGLSLQLSSFPETQAYRAADCIAVGESLPFGKVDLAFLPGSRPGCVEIMIRLGQPKRTRESWESELWQGSRILRSFPLSPDGWQSLSQWPAGLYRLHVKAGSQKHLDLDLRLL